MKKYFSVWRSDRFCAGLWTDSTNEQAFMRPMKSRDGLTRGRRMMKEVCLIWVYKIHQCNAAHNQMRMITGMDHKTSEQHVKFGRISKIRDLKYLLTSIN